MTELTKLKIIIIVFIRVLQLKDSTQGILDQLQLIYELK